MRGDPRRVGWPVDEAGSAAQSQVAVGPEAQGPDADPLTDSGPALLGSGIDAVNYEFDNVEHEGRYFLVEDGEYFNNEDYLVHDCESIGFEGKKYVVSLNHTSLNNTPIREVHGGATPEEVLVPYIIFGYDNESDIEYDISANTNEINISKDKEIGINISPKPPILPNAIWNNERLNIYKKDEKYFIQVDSLNKGTQKIVIKIDGIKIGEIEINIKESGMAVRKYDFG